MGLKGSAFEINTFYSMSLSLMPPTSEEVKHALRKLCEDFEDLQASDTLAVFRWAFSLRSRTVGVIFFFL